MSTTSMDLRLVLHKLASEVYFFKQDCCAYFESSCGAMLSLLDDWWIHFAVSYKYNKTSKHKKNFLLNCYILLVPNLRQVRFLIQHMLS